MKQEGSKNDQDKIPLELLSPIWLTGVGQVLGFGANKYTRYGLCDCVLNATKDNNMREAGVGPATINGLKKETPSISEHSWKTVPNGLKEIENTSPITIKGEQEMKPPLGMELQEKRWIESSTKAVSYVDERSVYASTTTIQQAESVDACVSPAMSESGGSKNPRGLNEHKRTCSSLKVVSSGKNNWRKGIAQSRLLGAALRHILAHMWGQDYDEESGLRHLYHASCCLMFASELIETRPDLDDRYKGAPQNEINPSETDCHK